MTMTATQTGYGVVPPPAELKKLRDLGMTHREIADRVFEETGFHVTRNAVTMALRRAGISAPVRRYDTEIPWKVSKRHERHYALAMLRALARRRLGLELSDEVSKRLDSWLANLSDRQWVVTYVPDSERGFYYTRRRKTDDPNQVIRRPE